jgi:hypothetical protein
MIVLKQRLALSFGMILGGAFISSIGLGAVFALGLYKEALGILPGIFGILGLFMLCVGAWTLAGRNQLAIAIDGTGIRIPTGNVFRPGDGFIARKSIASISKHETMKGRLVEVTLETGQKVFIQARHYCELDEFLSHCRANGLPVC